MVSRSQLPQLSRDATHLELICWTGNYVIKGRIQPFFRSNSLKCQSFLQMAMFRCKQKVASKYSKTLKTHFMVNTEHKSPCFVIPPPHSGPSHSDVDLFFKFRAWIDNGGDCVSVHSVCGTLLELNRGPRKNKTDNIGQLLLKVAVGGNH